MRRGSDPRLLRGVGGCGDSGVIPRSAVEGADHVEHRDARHGKAATGDGWGGGVEADGFEVHRIPLKHHVRAPQWRGFGEGGVDRGSVTCDVDDPTFERIDTVGKSDVWKNERPVVVGKSDLASDGDPCPGLGAAAESHDRGAGRTVARRSCVGSDRETQGRYRGCGAVEPEGKGGFKDGATLFANLDPQRVAPVSERAAIESRERGGGDCEVTGRVGSDFERLERAVADGGAEAGGTVGQHEFRGDGHFF